MRRRICCSSKVRQLLHLKKIIFWDLGDEDFDMVTLETVNNTPPKFNIAPVESATWCNTAYEPHNLSYAGNSI